MVMVDHLTLWVDAIPTTKATAQVVSKARLEQIIPRYGMVNKIISDRGTHFTSRVLEVAKCLGVDWKLYTRWHSQSWGRVERMSQTIKTTLTTLMLESILSWVRCLPLALLRVLTQPRADLEVSPYEMFGLPFLVTKHEVATSEVGETSVNEYMHTISKYLEDLRARGLIPQTTPLDFQIHNISPGDWVLLMFETKNH